MSGDPGKKYFKIGEVSRIAGLASSVLRFWETEFSQIKPKRTPTGQRLYRKPDLDIILEIKELLHDKSYTIRGAQKYLEEKSTHNSPVRKELLREIRSELKTILELL